MKLILEHIWVAFILATIINALIAKLRAKDMIKNDPSLESGYNKLFWGMIIYTNIPWIIMGVGNLTGYTNYIFEYFHPRTLNLAVLAFHGSILILWLLSIYWVYFNHGAEMIERHPGFFRISGPTGSFDVTAKQVKLFLPLLLLGGVIVFAAMWLDAFPALEMKF
ncbi:MAG: hypothetical protein HWE27_14170 [Gammaproteobacteria bacterium]|nr:hypothetical protein [Gammaproteobacteria bacterium]